MVEPITLKVIKEHLCIQAKVLECKGNTLVITGIPSYMQPLKGFVLGNNACITDYIGTYQIGMLYLNNPVKLEKNTIINITYLLH